MRTAERWRAIELRAEEGRSVKEIARLRRRSVVRQPLGTRCRALTAERSEEIWIAPPRTAREASTTGQRRRKRRLAFQEHSGDSLLAVAKRCTRPAACSTGRRAGKSRNSRCTICNADPGSPRFFVRFLRTYFDVADERVRVTCNLLRRPRGPIKATSSNSGSTRSSCLDSRLSGAIVNVYSKYSPKKRKNKLPYGTCRLCVHSTAVVQSIFGSIQEYGGFERPSGSDDYLMRFVKRLTTVLPSIVTETEPVGGLALRAKRNRPAAAGAAGAEVGRAPSAPGSRSSPGR